MIAWFIGEWMSAVLAAFEWGLLSCWRQLELLSRLLFQSCTPVYLLSLLIVGLWLLLCYYILGQSVVLCGGFSSFFLFLLEFISSRWIEMNESFKWILSFHTRARSRLPFQHNPVVKENRRNLVDENDVLCFSTDLLHASFVLFDCFFCE